MKTVGVRALKQNASAVIAEVVGGESMIVTDRGRAVARLVPIAGGVVQSLIAAGLARPAQCSATDLGKPLKHRAGEPRFQDVLAEMRGDERY
jgi:prevent-host-death family protein